MLKNPCILIDVYKVQGISMAICSLALCFENGVTLESLQLKTHDALHEGRRYYCSLADISTGEKLCL